MESIRKYPRTRHIEGSGLQKDDDPEVAPWALLKGRTLVVEEKLDGANTGISFSESGELRLQCRGHYLTGGPNEAQFQLFKPWAQTHRNWLWEALGRRYVLYGEWLYAKHTEFYDSLPHYFHEFDVLDLETDSFLSTPRRHALLAGGPVVSVPVIQTAMFSKLSDLTCLVSDSVYKSENWAEALRAAAEEQNLNLEMVLRETDNSRLAEGLYIKVEEEGMVQERYKWVRPGFLQTILDSGSHWKARPIVPNKLQEGASLW